MAAIIEDYVSFETAKLLKEKGFNERLFTFYITDEAKKEGYFQLMAFTDDNIDNNHSDHCYLAPTLQMAMKWLREAHNLVIQIEFIDFLEHGEVWLYSVIERKTIKQLTGRDEDFTEHSYEQACETAIKYCLENLI